MEVWMGNREQDILVTSVISTTKKMGMPLVVNPSVPDKRISTQHRISKEIYCVYNTFLILCCTPFFPENSLN
jgi:hypothetical protein